MGGGVVRVRRRRGLRDFESAVTDAPASRRWQRCSSDRAWLACRRRRWLLREAPLRLCGKYSSSVPPNCLPLLQKRFHTLVRVFSLHQLVQINILLLAQQVVDRSSASKVE